MTCTKGKQLRKEIGQQFKKIGNYRGKRNNFLKRQLIAEGNNVTFQKVKQLLREIE